MCRMYKTKLWGRACSLQIISLMKKQNPNNFKIKFYYSDCEFLCILFNVEESTVSGINVVVERLISVVVNSFFYGGRGKSNITLLGSVAPLRV